MNKVLFSAPTPAKKVAATSPVKGKKIKLLSKALTNPLRIFKLDNEHGVMVKARFIWEDKVNVDNKKAQNKFDYKILDIKDETITVYQIDQNLKEVLPEKLNASNFLMSIKIASLDLPCMDSAFICSVEEFKKQYKKQLKKLDFTINKLITDEITEPIALKQCLILTIGSFISLAKVGYICFEDSEDFVFITDYITSKIVKSSDNVYDGAVVMIDENSDDVDCTKGLRNGILALHNSHLVIHNGKIQGTSGYKEIMKVDYESIFGYANTLYGMETLPWKNLDKKDKPSEKRCFKFVTLIMEAETPLYFCIYHSRPDWTRQDNSITKYGAMYLNELWVNMFNFKIHRYNLKIAQEKMVRTVSVIDCNSHIMEPIKFQYRLSYLNAKHKINQLVTINKFDNQKAIPFLEVYKSRLKSKACNSVQLCIKALDVCVKKQLLSLKYKGYKIAWTLQNPFIAKVPKSGISVREYPRNSIGVEIVKEAETFLGIKPTKGKIIVDTSKYKFNKELASTTHMKIAMNTFMFFFSGNVKITNSKDALKYVMLGKPYNQRVMLRKISLTTFAGQCDPFLELFNHIRNTQFTGASKN